MRSHELTVFLEFARTANLSGDHGAAEPRDPPEPDIMFPTGDRPCYFELGRLADDNFAKFMLEVYRRAPVPVAPDLSKIGYPQRDVLRRKLAKTYNSRGMPIHLLLYYDNESPLTQGPIPPLPFDHEASAVMEPILRRSMGPFEKLWYFERYRRTVLWRYPA